MWWPGPSAELAARIRHMSGCDRLDICVPGCGIIRHMRILMWPHWTLICVSGCGRSDICVSGCRFTLGESLVLAATMDAARAQLGVVYPADST